MRREYDDCVKDILEHPAVKQMAEYVQHGETTTLDHCKNVSWYSYCLAKRFGLDYRAAARAGLLHDLFLYDWHEHCQKTGNHFHGLTHPEVALRTARQLFVLDPVEVECIRHHMWPLTFFPPRYKESYLVLLVDKICSFEESTGILHTRFLRFLSLKLNRI